MPAPVTQSPPPIRVLFEDPAGRPQERVFAKPFKIGRSSSCDLCIESPRISREHLEIRFRDGCWHARDLASSNGTYLDSKRIEETPIRGEVALRLAEDGPTLRLRVAEAPPERPRTPARNPAPKPPQPKTGERDAASPPRGRDDDHYIRHYLSENTDETDQAGERTLMIRRAFQTVQRNQRRRWRGVLAGVLLIAVGLIGFAIFQNVRSSTEQARLTRKVEKQGEKLEKARTAVSAIFDEIRSLEAQIAQLQMLMEASTQTGMHEQLEKLEESRRRLERRYDGYVEELGLRRSLGPEERLIYHVARVFNESEFGMPADFVRRVRESIRENWQTPAGRERFQRAVRRAQEMGYTPEIVRTLLRFGLPPQFFYLALQESDFDVNAIGPATAWGRAKGMWQFIPRTALVYGLDPGPFADKNMVDPHDDRHDFAKSTRAAASYLRVIYATLAQASGLLVVASYNWGEHRVVSKLGTLEGPQAIPQSAFEGIPENAEARSYWRFLGEFSDRMPEETKDYVLRIFSAAVVGEDPRRFGFDFDNPLEPYLEREEK